MSIEGKGCVTWGHPKFPEAVRRWEQVRALDDCPYKHLYDLKLWRSVLEVMDDGTMDLEGSVDWLLQESWERERNVRDVFNEWRERVRV